MRFKTQDARHGKGAGLFFPMRLGAEGQSKEVERVRRLEKENQRGGDRTERWGGGGLRNLGTGIGEGGGLGVG